MSDFTAKIIAQLDTSKIPSQISQIGKTGINLSNVKIKNVQMDTSKLASQVQAALNRQKFTINISKIGLGNVSNFATSSLTKSLTDRINSQISSGGIEASIAKVTAQYEKLGTTGHSKLSQIKSDIETLNKLQSQMSTSSNSKALVSNYEKFNETLAKVKNNLTTVSAESKTFATSFQINTLDNKISQWAANNSRAMSTFGADIANVQSQLRALASSGEVPLSSLKSLENEFKNISLAATQAGLTGKTFGDTMRGAFSSITKYVSVSTVIYQSVRAIREMVDNVYEVDTAMTELYRVTNLSASQYKSLYADMTNSAKEYGASLSEIIDSTASWVRLGFDSQTANKLAEITTMYQHVTDLDESTAVDNLVTAYKGFQEQLDELYSGDSAAAVEYVADIFDKLGNEFAVTAANVGDGLTNCASALEVAGNSIQESAAMVTGITEVTQDASKAGNALRTLSMRLRGTDAEELEALGEDTEGLISVTSKLQDNIKSLTGVDLVDAEGQLRSTYDVMSDLAKVWDSLDGNTQSNVLETIAGKNRASDIAALLKNWNQVESAMQAATNAEGTAAQEQETWSEHIQASVKKLQASWEALSNTIINSDFLKALVDSGTSLLDLLDNLISKFGTIPTLLAGIAAAMSFKNVGRDKMFSL
jgi:TP901 family phage tail tape measure protein